MPELLVFYGLPRAFCLAAYLTLLAYRCEKEELKNFSGSSNSIALTGEVRKSGFLFWK
jgi:hypothetical protein